MNSEVNWTELLMKEYPQEIRCIEAMRSDGLSDEEIYSLFESMGV